MRLWRDCFWPEADVDCAAKTSTESGAGESFWTLHHIRIVRTFGASMGRRPFA